MRILNNRKFTARLLMLMLSLIVMVTLPVFAVDYQYSANNPPEGARYDASAELWNGKGIPTAGQGILTSNGTLDNAILRDMPEKELHTRIRATMQSLNDAVETDEPSVDGISRSECYKLLQRIRRKFDGDIGIVMLLSESNYKADLVQAAQTLSGFQNTINLLIGLLAWGLLLFSGVTTVMDLAYIFIPLLQTKTAQQGDMKTGGGNKPRWVTEEAYSAVRDSTNSMGAYGQSSGYQSAGLLYLKRRYIAIIALVFALTLLLSSKFMTFIASGAGRLLSGLLEQIGLM